MGFAFKHWMEPVALVDECIRITPKVGNDEYFIVNHIVPLPGYEVNVASTLTTGTESSKREMVELEMNHLELAQFRVEPIDNFKLNIYQFGEADPLYATRAYNFGIYPWVGKRDASLLTTEHFVYKDNVPYYSAYNDSGATLAVNRVRIYGIKYYLTKLPVAEGSKPALFTTVPVGRYRSNVAGM